MSSLVIRAAFFRYRAENRQTDKRRLKLYPATAVGVDNDVIRNCEW